ncbi:inorganic diphosphatase activity protein [Coemansia sp. IMI 203386]|nr:inorganic diphosphatase activity protein [Coemansia sp. IMI 203386]
MLSVTVRALSSSRCSHRPLATLTAIRWHHSKYETSQLGGPTGTPKHHMYFNHQGNPLSPWHDIPLVADKNTGLYNMVCEIPRWSNAKLEIDTKSPFNPIKQDIKKGKPRFVANVFPHKGYIWNYGALPQTFEDPEHRDVDTGCVGDSDPLDVIEIGQEICAQGSVHPVKVLGLVALIDDGETDWKVFAIRADDPLAHKVSDIGDLETHMPGLVDATVDWFTKYKVPDGKPLNKWAFDGKPKDAEYARTVIASTHEAWKRLVLSANSDANSGFGLTNVSVESSPHYLMPSDASDAFKALTDRSPGQMCPDPPAQNNEPDPAADMVPSAAPSKWYYVDSSGSVAN